MKVDATHLGVTYGLEIVGVTATLSTAWSKIWKGHIGQLAARHEVPREAIDELVANYRAALDKDEDPLGGLRSVCG